MVNIGANIEIIRQRIAAAAKRAGRDPEVILLLAVTKLHDPCEIDEAIDAGITDIGENKVQEVLKKYDQVTKPVRWHLIGHLQTNKVKQIIDKAVMIHSVDSLHLAQEIDKRSLAAGKVMDVLLEVNVGGEESKSGAGMDELEDMFKQILESCPNVRIRGLMTVAPAVDDPEDARCYFKQVKEMYDKLAEYEHSNSDFKYLSMGMSHDFEVAIEEGSNIVRVGTAIFGARDYDKII